MGTMKSRPAPSTLPKPQLTSQRAVEAGDTAGRVHEPSTLQAGGVCLHTYLTISLQLCRALEILPCYPTVSATTHYRKRPKICQGRRLRPGGGTMVRRAGEWQGSEVALTALMTWWCSMHVAFPLPQALQARLPHQPTPSHASLILLDAIASPDIGSLCQPRPGRRCFVVIRRGHSPSAAPYLPPTTSPRTAVQQHHGCGKS
ncbi:hypothetical protein BCR34DRAFT_570876 [Clohesyomyces aquaticus]|uniref:Uncharacterized protein n=1 Tax=Clohesyomyces aquaticus TaxID=1231657 RepID=A0A1Y1ZAP1_9PLEO|nr:hypothetical protein BCR34DRAFT_570876 [Clohesyomyces aquaticus]